ncbi:uncharacterized protein [Littorina saxatilis]|uniref:uncharacterized protein n=1 Tax=Littorina saxatilis TaxID=31220 RepID=UPI0038B5A406
MSIFSNRPTGYKAGVFLFFFSYVFFIVGYAMPYWATADFFMHHQDTYTSVDVHEGLWMFCQTTKKLGDNDMRCAALGVSGLDAWLHAVRLLECVCVIGLSTACAHAVYTNFSRSLPGPFSRCLEMWAAMSGIIGFIGCMVYAGKVNHRTDEQEQSLVLGTAIIVLLKEYTLTWAFYSVVVGSILSVAAAVVIAVFNKDPFKYNLLGTPIKCVDEVLLLTTTCVTEGRGQDQGQGQGCPAVEGDQVHRSLYGQPQPYGEPQPVTVGYSEAGAL